MGAKGRIQSQVTLDDKTTGETEAFLHKSSKGFDTHLLEGNKLAKVGGSCFYRRGRDYNKYVLGMESWVELTCNQDDTTIMKAQHLALRMAEAKISKLSKVFDAYLGVEEEE